MAIEITDVMSGEERYTCLMGRLASFCVAIMKSRTDEQALSPERITALIGDDKWMTTVVKAWEILNEKGDANAFLKDCAYTNEPYREEITS